jgi:hypothetical protein
VGHEIQIPVLRVVQVGETALDQGPDEVQGQGRVLVAAQQPFRVRPSRLRVEFDAVDQLTPIRGERDAVAGLGVRRSRFGILPGEAPDANDLALEPIGQHQRHLQQNLELVGDDIGPALVEPLGAGATLEQKALPDGRLSELLFEALDLPRGHQGRQLPQSIHRPVQSRLIVIGRLLEHRPFEPRSRSPRRHGTASLHEGGAGVAHEAPNGLVILHARG